uniref:RCC1 domain-containing protein 1 n=1 Tax=Homalodisca liturata TaxID=320908 RepID=A0A1B6JUZ2_9HEMI
MSIIVSGFNGFEQFKCVCTFLKDRNYNKSIHGNANLNCGTDNSVLNLVFNSFPINFNTTFAASWSYCLSYHGDTLWLFGYVGRKLNCIKNVKLPKGEKINQVSCSRRHILCVTETGTCWQYSLETDQLKDLSGILTTELQREDAIREFVVKVSCGETITAVLTDKGSVYNMPNKLELRGEKIVDIACGRSHILMLSERGEVFSIGEGSRGQLGHGELENEEEPRLVEGLAGLVVVAVVCGGWHSCALTSDGDLYSWGWNMAGQLGLYNQESRGKVSVQAIPQVVDWPDQSEIHVSKVACGARHTVTLLDDGSVWGCGWNGYNQLALAEVDSVDQMTRLPVDGSVRHIVCGPWSTCFIT